MMRTLPAAMRPTIGLLAVVAAMLVWASPEASAAPRVTVIGDSVQASFGFAPQATRRLASPGLSVRMEAAVCRKLSSPGCLGGRPESALALAHALGTGLGDVVVMHIGYNDFAARYDIGAALSAFRRAGVRAVVWVTLREAHSHYATTNALIRSAARRANARGGLPLVRVADWNSFSVGRPWFTSDRVHLNSAGAFGLAGLLRENVLAALAEVGTSVDGRPVTTRADTYPLGRTVERIAGEGDALWLAGGGRLSAISELSGRRLPQLGDLAEGEDLASDGVHAWLRDPIAGALSQPSARLAGTIGPQVEGLGVQPLLANAGPRGLWAVTACRTGDAVCAATQTLSRVRSPNGDRRDLLLSTDRVVAASGDKRDLWLLIRGEDDRARLERRDPETGNLVRSIGLPDKAGTGRVVAGRGKAWLLTSNGQLLKAGRSGTVRRVHGRLRAVAAVGRQLWALKKDGRTILRMNPSTGRIRGQARATVRLAHDITFTRRYVWVLTASGRQVIRLRRR